MPIFLCKTTSKICKGPKCIVIIYKGSEPEICPYHIWSGIKHPPWKDITEEYNKYKKMIEVEK